MDLSTLVLAPPTRVNPEASRVAADSIFGGWMLVAVGVAALFAFLAWSRARKLRAEVWKVRGLRPGIILVPGTAELTREDKEAQKPPAACIELTIVQQGVQRRSKNNHYIQWTESERTLDERPFMLRTEGGELVRVESGSKIELVDRLENPVRRNKTTRHRIARITPGEKIWVRGQLSTGSSSADTGPYRGGGGPSGFVLRPPRLGTLLVTSQPIEKEGLADARFHAIFAGLFGFLLLVFQTFVFDDYHAVRATPVATTGSLESRRDWITRSKNSTTHHYAFTVRHEVDGQRYVQEHKTNSVAYTRVPAGAQVAVTYAARDPRIAMLGTPREIGTSTGSIIFASIMTFVVALAYALIYYQRQPWWRRKTLVEQENGVL